MGKDAALRLVVNADFQRFAAYCGYDQNQEGARRLVFAKCAVDSFQELDDSEEAGYIFDLYVREPFDGWAATRRTVARDT